MKLTKKIAEHKVNRPFYTLEFFPPKTEQGFENLLARISRLVSLDPLAISVTWGAGGTTKERSLDLAGVTQADHGVDTILHLTCTNMQQGMVDDALRDAKQRGIENILALRGDPPRGEEYWIPTDRRFTHGADLVSYIKSSPEFSSGFCVGVAAYPDGHTDGDIDNDGELEFLKAKVDAGADFIVTQLFYDVDNFLRWVKKVRAKGIRVPIIPGIMPMQTYASFLRMTKLCGTRIPTSLMADLEPIRHDDQQVKDYGVKLAIGMIQKLTEDGDIRGVHFCTLNLERSVYRVLEGLGWTGTSPKITNKLITDMPTAENPELIVTAHSATDSAANSLTTGVPLEVEAGKGELNNASAWDDFPNGRFGDYKSPAYGETDLWGSSTMSRKQALAQWGHPKSLEDLTDIFVRHLHSEIATTPFSPSPLNPESLMILTQLEKLTRMGWWTVGSQPAIDGASSADSVVGWGPRGGYVYQKSFVEFFVEKTDLEKIKSKVETEGGGWVNYFAGNVQGECWTNMPDDGRNAVTWGVFPGQEVAQSTIIEKESFLSWKDEAFSIWVEWASFYPPDSAERKLLDSILDQRWLLSIVHHDYTNPDALWTFLFKDSPDT
ncbi:methylenetetrahydrofolate reduct [Sparassis latifolia]|uniref:Methylenetetrahydrofolate reductase 2 n=1 Tax=Sparassis crispa TaxID=139825 RepID=A0A401GI78_9APHY|nr:Methylenetetrahydrofolate reductase 2 [Sparassis crispa]GBE81900.1 Methylenetetrahydrofolate reductase 2 [Sparassis crispa]